MAILRKTRFLLKDNFEKNYVANFSLCIKSRFQQIDLYLTHNKDIALHYRHYKHGIVLILTTTINRKNRKKSISFDRWIANSDLNSCKDKCRWMLMLILSSLVLAFKLGTWRLRGWWEISFQLNLDLSFSLSWSGVAWEELEWAGFGSFTELTTLSDKNVSVVLQWSQWAYCCWAYYGCLVPAHCGLVLGEESQV